MTDTQALQEEITFLDNEIDGLRTRIGSTGNTVQAKKLDMLKRLKARCERSLAAIEKRAAA